MLHPVEASTLDGTEAAWGVCSDTGQVDHQMMANAASVMGFCSCDGPWSVGAPAPVRKTSA